ncbi:MAG: hypothetical protein M1817_003408 [Caeruleum heppii]|nr:MAG: hypothetical protein M1817_003408 [Caeruleum heppii]
MEMSTGAPVTPDLEYYVPAGDGKILYDPFPLATGRKVPELWNEQGDTLVHLFPRPVNRPPAFKVDTSVYSSSRALRHLIHDGVNGNRQISLEAATGELSLDVPGSPRTDPDARSARSMQSTRSVGSSRSLVDPDLPQRDVHLFFPIALSPNANTTSSENIEILLAVRNLFAFLTRQPLVVSPRRPTYFDVFLGIAEILEIQDFTNLDGSTFGEVPSACFEVFVEELKLADVRRSHEKTVEAIVLSERMKSEELYNEAFVHAVGKFNDIKALGSPKYGLISHITRNRLERASLDLELRIKSVQQRLGDFEFPSLFAGIANSSQLPEGKTVHFKAWKVSFLAFRRHILSHYKEQFGAWPPKARSRKHEFEESGLNRMVLQLMYRDMTDLYDLLVDRVALTSRTIDMPSHEDRTESIDPDRPTPRALRRVLSEFDRSTPPVQPPIPFDTPLLPQLVPPSVDGNGPFKRDKREPARRLRDQDLDGALNRSYNLDANKPTLFLASFKAFERKNGQGKTIEDLRDQRNGYWIFLYAVLQSLPLLTVDAPGVKWNQGVEYFLCETPKGGPPWIRDKSTMRKSWYGIAGGSGVVSLPSDVVDHGIEGIYRRSHCWTAAERWTAPHDQPHDQMSVETPPATEPNAYLAPLAPPGKISAPSSHYPSPPPSAAGSTMSCPPIGVRRSPPMLPVDPSARRQSNRSSVYLGLEALPVPSGVDPSGLGLPSSASIRSEPQHDPNKRFEDILGKVESKKVPQKGRKR